MRQQVFMVCARMCQPLGHLSGRRLIPDGLAHPLYQMKRYLVASGNMSSQILIDSMTYAQSITTAVADRVLKNNGQPSRPLTSSFERR
jgi:hypothetical protein